MNSALHMTNYVEPVDGDIQAKAFRRLRQELKLRSIVSRYVRPPPPLTRAGKLNPRPLLQVGVGAGEEARLMMSRASSSTNVALDSSIGKDGLAGLPMAILAAAEASRDFVEGQSNASLSRATVTPSFTVTLPSVETTAASSLNRTRADTAPATGKRRAAGSLLRRWLGCLVPPEGPVRSSSTSQLPDSRDIHELAVRQR